MALIKAELASATDTMGPSVTIYPSLALRAKLAEFAVRGGLSSEKEALAVVAMRYFRMEESDRWAGWLSEESMS